MSYPDNCLRGISVKDGILEDGTVASHVFYFKDPRPDGWIEQSINWEDDADALPFTLTQRRKEGTLQFPFGVAVVPRAELDKLAALPALAGRLSYERRREKENPYHGNLILRENTPAPTRRQMAATIAMHVSRVVQQQSP